MRVGRELFGEPPLSRLAHTHALSAAADAFFAVSLAGSLFFSVSVDAARPRVILYLLLTMAPFAVVAPLVGPVIDRVPGGHRVVVGLTIAARGVLSAVMAGHLRSLLFYPEAFGILVLGKTYSVAKNAIVPRLVDDPAAFVAANSHLARLNAVAATAGGALAAGLLAVGEAPLVLRVGAGVYAAGAVLALRLRRPRAHPPVSPRLEQAELHAPGLVLAASAMGILRAAVGFLTFFLGFALRQAGEPVWFFGAVLAAGAVGAFVGTFVAPRLRHVLDEEPILALSLAVPALLALSAALDFNRVSAIAVVFAVGLTANVGRSAFDSLVQDRAPDVDRGRAFARFETRFQLAWVLGALVPVALQPPRWLGLPLLAALLGFGAVSYAGGSRAARHRPPDPALPLHAQVLRTAERLVAEGAHRQAALQALVAVDVLAGSLRRDHGEPLEGAHDGPAPGARLEAVLGQVLGRSPAADPVLRSGWRRLERVREALAADAPVSPAEAEEAVEAAGRLITRAGGG